MRGFGAVLIAATLAWAALGVQTGAAAERVALLLGNGAYAHTGRLLNPAADVAAMETALRGLGYEVETAADLDRRNMGRALRRFARRAARADTAVLFYSGHGMEIAGRNYLVPVDAELELEEDAGFEAIALDDVVAAAAGAKRLSVVILDACRDNRFSSATRSGTRGFQPVRARRGQLIAYAAAAGAVAYDGDGALSPYTQALTEALGDPARAGSDVRVLFGGLSRRVSELAGGAQNPAVYQSGFGPERVALTTAPTPRKPELERAPLGGRDAAAKAAYDDAAREGLAAAMRDVAELFPGTYWGRKAAREAARLPEGARAASRHKSDEGFGARLQAHPRGRSLKECDACPALVAIPRGDFTMGSPDGEAQRGVSEGPRRRVTIRPFALGRDTVTVAEFGRFMRATGHSQSGGCWTPSAAGDWSEDDSLDWDRPGFAQGDDHPAVCVSWDDAKAYVAWLNDQVDGAPYRLPSEAEQEYVLRADHGDAAYPWGGEANAGCRSANGGDLALKRSRPEWRWTVSNCDDGHPFTAPGGAFAANKWGVRQLAGNVWEWAEDCWHSDYAGAPSDGAARTADACTQSALRGGSWNVEPWRLRSAFRNQVGRSLRGVEIGFRVARTLE